MIDAKPVNLDGQIGQFIVLEELERLLEQRFLVSSSQPGEGSATEEAEAKKKNNSLFIDVLRGPENTEKRTGLLTRIWDCETTSRFFQRCKEEGVTVNSGLTALGNVALVELLLQDKEELLQEDATALPHDSCYTLKTSHRIDLRRLWPPVDGAPPATILGCHVAIIFIPSETPRKANPTQFWNYARQVHKNIHRHLKREDVIEGFAASLKHGVPACDVRYNNMGNVTSLLMNEKEATSSLNTGKRIELVELVRSSRIHNTNIVWGHNVHTYEGCFSHTLRYNTRCVTADLAAKYQKAIMDHLQEII